jgi:hypothetical protein
MSVLYPYNALDVGEIGRGFGKPDPRVAWAEQFLKS